MEEDKKIQEAEVQEAQIVEEEIEEQWLTPEEQSEKKIKNLISLVILLSGLLLGSLFVDVAQMIRGTGFSQRILNQTDAFASDGKTWVAYSEPIVKVQIVNDDTCEQCKPDEALVGLRRIMPTMLTEKVDASSEKGKALLAKFNLKTIPAFIFSKDVEKTDLFSQAQPFFDKQGDSYSLKTAEIGLAAGKYVAAPSVDEQDIQIGNKDSKVKVVEFSDFQCPYCKQVHEKVMNKLVSEYGDRVNFVFKQFPLNIHPQAQGASLAAACANQQGKFQPYADRLFATQEAWGRMKDAKSTFKMFAVQLKLNTADFNKCLDDQKYKDLVSRNLQEGLDFGIAGTPSIFVNDQFQEGQVTYDSLKKAIDEQLSK